MSWLVSILRELVSLFVDDLPYAIAILATIVAAGVAARASTPPSALIGIGLLAGLVAVLLAGTVLKARSVARARAGHGQQ